jgi:hypothetical protein
VARHVAGEEGPDRLHRLGEIDVAPPHPFPAPLSFLLEERQHGGGLRVVDEDEVRPFVESRGVDAHAIEVGALHRLGPGDAGALQRVVHQLGDREEFLAAFDQLPVRVDAEVLEQRDLALEELRHPSTERRAAEVDEAGALERLGGGTESLDRFLTGGLTVVVDPLRFGDRDARQHHSTLQNQGKAGTQS